MSYLNHKEDVKICLFECSLAASTEFGHSPEEPKLTNLDRGVWYDLRIKKLNEKQMSDKLFVSFRLRLHSNFTGGFTQNTLFSKWHPNESSIYEVQYQPQDESDVNYVDHHNDVSSFHWNSPSEEVVLKIRFNCVSSQFPFRRDLFSSENAIFVFSFKVLSENSGCVLCSLACQIKLFWIGGKAIADKMAKHRFLISNQSTATPTCEYTPLVSHEEEDSDQGIDCTEDDYLVNNDAISEYSLSNDDQCRNLSIFYILHSTQTLSSVIRKSDQLQFKAIQLNKMDKSFVVELHPKYSSLREGSKYFVRTIIELNPANRKFSSEDVEKWSACRKAPMIELNYDKSRLNNQVFDCRQLDENSLELIWLVDCESSEIELSLNINRVFTKNAEPLLIEIKSYDFNNWESIIAYGLCAILVREIINDSQAYSSDWLIQNEQSNAIEELNILNTEAGLELLSPNENVMINYKSLALFVFKSMAYMFFAYCGAITFYYNGAFLGIEQGQLDSRQLVIAFCAAAFFLIPIHFL